MGRTGDRTSGHETYAASRFLYAPYPGPDGTTVVDFNKAYNPPCAFTAFSTCPFLEVPYDPPAWSAERRDWLLPQTLEIATDGTIAAPPGPGLGAAPDFDALEQYRVG